MQQRVNKPNTDQLTLMPRELLELWRHFLQEHDLSPGTVKKYTQAVTHFLD